MPVDPLIYFPEYRSSDLTSDNGKGQISSDGRLGCKSQRSDTVNRGIIIYGEVIGDVEKRPVRIAQNGSVVGNITVVTSESAEKQKVI